MGVIRLTLLTAVLLWLAMYYFGRDEGLPEDRIGRAPAPASERVATPEPAPVANISPPPETTPQPAPAETRRAEPPTPVPAETPPATTVPTPPLAVEPPANTPPPAIATSRSEPPTPITEAPAAAEPKPVLYVTGRRVNMRAGPATSFAVVTSLPRGTAVTDLGPAGDGWHEIRTETGETGYMSGDFLSPDPQ